MQARVFVCFQIHLLFNLGRAHIAPYIARFTKYQPRVVSKSEGGGGLDKVLIPELASVAGLVVMPGDLSLLPQLDDYVCGPCIASTADIRLAVHILLG
ncbi:hypothetical protein BJV74DRAFT_448447 [Russula compacta]|nr:hypothetical protein BJV74DRAFT_448447 [Russula compacta]